MTTAKWLIGFLAFSMVLTSLNAIPPQQKEKKVSVDGLIYDLKHPDASRRREAARLLGENKIHQAVPALVTATTDSDESVRLEAVRALVEINDPRALQAYIRLTHDTSKPVQEKAIEGIINLYVVEEGGFVQGVKKVVDVINPFSDDYNPLVVEPYMPVSQDAVDAVADLLGNSSSDLRKEAATALGILRAGSALKSIESTLAHETDSDVKVELIRAIYKIGDPSAGPTLLPLIQDPDKKVHDEAIFTLGRLRIKEAVPNLKKLYEAGVEERRKVFGIVPVSGSDDLQKKILEALAYIGDPSCKDIFVNALNDRRDFYRRYGAEGLGRIGAKEMLMELARKHLREDSDSARLAMGFALYKLGREENIVELIEHIDGDQAFNYLLEFQPQQVKQLFPFVQSEKNSTKVRLLNIIGLRGDPSALPVVEEMTKSRDTDVVSAANLAIRRIRGRYNR